MEAFILGVGADSSVVRRSPGMRAGVLGGTGNMARRPEDGLAGVSSL